MRKEKIETIPDNSYIIAPTILAVKQEEKCDHAYS